MASNKMLEEIRPPIALRRAYEPASPIDGKRFLVDRLWPRGLTKAAVRADGWVKEAAPSAELRKWFAHDPEKWTEFQQRYRAELAARPEALAPLLDAVHAGPITLVYGAKDVLHNEAVVLREVLTELLKTETRTSETDPVGDASSESFPARDAPAWATSRARMP